MSFVDILKNILFVLLFAYAAPILFQSIHKQYAQLSSTKTQVGVLTLQGCIEDSSTLSKQLHTFFKNQDIKAILLKIDCPGGATGSSQSMHDELKALKRDYPKPVVVLVENTCASGAYYVASAADAIVAPGISVIGSIGVYIPYFFQLREFIEQYKIKYTSMKAGSYKALGDPFNDVTPQEKALLQSVLDDSYEQFVADVAVNRKISITDSRTWADGKIFSGRQAKALGLIDEIGSAHQAIKIIKEKALIEGEIEWVKPPQESSLSALFHDSLSDQTDTPFVKSFITQCCNELESRYLTRKVG